MTLLELSAPPTRRHATRRINVGPGNIKQVDDKVYDHPLCLGEAADDASDTEARP